MGHREFIFKVFIEGVLLQFRNVLVTCVTIDLVACFIVDRILCFLLGDMRA